MFRLSDLTHPCLITTKDSDCMAPVSLAFSVVHMLPWQIMRTMYNSVFDNEDTNSLYSRLQSTGNLPKKSSLSLNPYTCTESIFSLLPSTFPGDSFTLRWLSYIQSNSLRVASVVFTLESPLLITDSRLHVQHTVSLQILKLRYFLVTSRMSYQYYPLVLLHF